MLSILLELKELNSRLDLSDQRCNQLESKLDAFIKSKEKLNFFIISLIIGALFSAGIKPSIEQFLMISDDRRNITYEAEK